MQPDPIDPEVQPGQTPSGAVVFFDDALRVLRKLPSDIVQCCVTSPPYWGLRDYGSSNQIGGEPTIEQYIRRLTRVFGEVQRVLRPDGTLWLNIGDCYTSGNRGWRAPDKKNGARAMDARPPTPNGLKEKELVGVPWRLAFALQRCGWYLRSDIVWSKPNSQPESVKDRPTLSHEYVFLLTKSKRYYYNQMAVREPTVDGSGQKNRRSVWTMNAYSRVGGAVTPFPEDLVRLCVLAGSRPGDLVIDPFLGSGTVGIEALASGRAFVGVELELLWAQLAKSRFEKSGASVEAITRASDISKAQAQTLIESLFHNSQAQHP
jgi:site-specific DNA-methyltransferase (cytosine-N4-specific)